MKYNPFEIQIDGDDERYAEIVGFSGAVVQSISYRTDGGGDGFLNIAFSDGRIIRADSMGASWSDRD